MEMLASASARKATTFTFSTLTNTLVRGLANKKTVTIQPGRENAVVISTTKTKKQNKPALLRNKSVLKKDFSRMVKAVSNQIRPWMADVEMNVPHIGALKLEQLVHLLPIVEDLTFVGAALIESHPIP